MLQEAGNIESPLAQPFVCGPDTDIEETGTQNNGIVEVSIRRVCLNPDQTGNSGIPVMIVVGRLYNPDPDEALDVLPAHRLFQLQAGDTTVAADQRFETEYLPNFANPLAPFSGRDFAVSFTLVQSQRDWAIVHPAQAGELRFPVAVDGVLVTGANLPGVLRPSATAPTPKIETKTVAEDYPSTPLPAEPEAEAEPKPEETLTCYFQGDRCVDLAASAFADEIPHWFTKSEFIGDPKELLGPPDAGSGMTLGCGGEVVAILNELLLVDGPGVDLQIFSDIPIGPDVSVHVARTSEQWFELIPSESPGGFDISELPGAGNGFDLVSLANNGTGCTDANQVPRITGIAAVFGRSWTRVERRDGYSDLPGYPISRGVYGGEITRLDRPSQDVDPIFLDWEPSVLNDNDTYNSYRVHADNIEKPSSFAVIFDRGATARIAAVRTYTEASSGFTYHPDRLSIFASQTGTEGPWHQVGLTLSVNDDVFAEEFRFAAPVIANALRVDFIPKESSESYRGEINQSIAEIEVVETEESDEYSSILNRVTINALDPIFDGHLVSFTSQFDEAKLSASSVLSNPIETFWQPETDVLPQEFIFAFRGHDRQSIDRVTATLIAQTALPDDWSPLIRVEASEDVSPLKGFRSLGNMTADPATGRLELDLENAVSVRYLRLVIVDAGIMPYGVTLVTARGQLAKFLASNSVTQRQTSNESTRADTENEPENDALVGATVLAPNALITGRPNSNADVDYYRIDVKQPGTSAVTLQLTGLPRVKVNVTLLDHSGDKIAETPATGNATERYFTWLLDQGTYYIRLKQNPATMALFIDNSGSLGPAIFDALDAAEGFITKKTPEEEISLFSFSNAAVRLVDRTGNVKTLTGAIETWRNSAEAGTGRGTTVYDSVMDGIAELADVAGNKAVVLFTDGADATSTRNPSMFWDEISTIDAPVFIIGYGEEMEGFIPEIGSKAGDAMRSIALAAEGGFFTAPTPQELPGVFADIANSIRAHSGYGIRFEVSPGLGELEVLEVGGQMVSSGVLGNAIIIFDASGSMKARTDAGRRRINVARSVLFDLLAQVPEEVPMGVWLYGHSLAAKPKSKSCRDVELMVPPEPANREQIKEVAKDISPKGQTPIGYALSRAGEMFTAGQSGLVILLTDGEETCDAEPDSTYYPDRVVQDLIDRGIDLRVNIVGFDVDDPRIQAELSSVAQRTGGNFFYGEGQEGLREAMTSAFTAPIEVLDDTGRIVATGLVGDGPISLPQGSYRVQISGTDFISDRQTVLGGRATRLFLSQEANAVRVRAEDVEIGTPYAAPTMERDPTPETTMHAFDPDARVPETMEELVFKTQDLLAKLGYDPGPLDGAMGGKTRRAAQAFLENNGPLLAGEAFDSQRNPTLFLWFELFATVSELR